MGSMGMDDAFFGGLQNTVARCTYGSPPAIIVEKWTYSIDHVVLIPLSVAW
jgi:hypothetical protein